MQESPPATTCLLSKAQEAGGPLADSRPRLEEMDLADHQEGTVVGVPLKDYQWIIILKIVSIPFLLDFIP